MTARTPDGTSSGYFLRSHFDINKLDTKRIAREAVRKALEGANPRTIEPGAYTVILEPQAVADLLGNLSFGFNARSADEGRSPYSAPGGKRSSARKYLTSGSAYTAIRGIPNCPARNRRKVEFHLRNCTWSRMACWRI